MSEKLKKVLFTLPGRIGDNLSRIPIAYKYAIENNIKVDFILDKPSFVIKELLKKQNWVGEVKISPHDMRYVYGGQPHNMNVSKNNAPEYDEIYHLGCQGGKPINNHFTLCGLRDSGCPVSSEGLLDLQPIYLEKGEVKNLVVHMDCKKPSMRECARKTISPIFNELPFENIYFIGTDFDSDFYNEFKTKNSEFIDTREGFHLILPYLANSVVFCVDSSIRWLSYCCNVKSAVSFHSGECSFNGEKSPNETIVNPGDHESLMSFFNSVRN